MEISNIVLVEIPELERLLEVSSANHKRLCPRQVLGVRMGLAGMRSVDLTKNHAKKDLLVIIETDACFANGVIAATRV